MKIYLVNETINHEDGGVEYQTETTVAVYTCKDLAEAVALRGGWSVLEVESDPEFRDSWFCHLAFDGKEVELIGPSPVRELPESKPDPWKTGVYGYGWTAEESRNVAHRIYVAEVADVYRKLNEEIESRIKRLGST